MTFRSLLLSSLSCAALCIPAQTLAQDRGALDTTRSSNLPAPDVPTIGARSFTPLAILAVPNDSQDIFTTLNSGTDILSGDGSAVVGSVRIPETIFVDPQTGDRVPGPGDDTSEDSPYSVTRTRNVPVVWNADGPLVSVPTDPLLLAPQIFRSIRITNWLGFRQTKA